MRTLSLISFVSLLLNSCLLAGPRSVISLDGQWDIAQGSMDQVPARFEAKAPVPGLADMAEPAFEAVGQEKQSDALRQAFWYRRTFDLQDPVPPVAQLKIHKACFATRVFLNGKLVGDHVGSFTPGLFDIRGQLQAGRNELVVRVGASRSALPKTVPDGHDFEKIRYIPGLYDSVELILTGSPQVTNIQTVPDLPGRRVRVVATIRATGEAAEFKPVAIVREAKGGKEVARGEGPAVTFDGAGEKTVEMTLLLGPTCRFWTPEDPFLYDVEIAAPADALTARFGMRSFRLDPKSGLAVLNGRPYPMRGTNVCIFRFMEDPTRGDRPWREEWVRRLHRVFKSIGWNSIRYCIGFPPELWYRIADEEGLLIQDEFPIWYGGKWPGELKADGIIPQYVEWMRERWNHPCVVIWDAQNESINVETGKAIAAVRKLDLSNRPWDNGWAAPDQPGDVFESHPYLMGNASFRLSGMSRVSPTPRGNPHANKEGNAIIINEYGWLWLNRDGTPTTLTRKVYLAQLGDSSTTEQRRTLYARTLAAKTEFWRVHRKCAGVLHFCGLGYSRPNGQTSDHFTDIETLDLEPCFGKYVRDAFRPVCVMLDFWDQELTAGGQREFRVLAINDRYEPWTGKLRVRLGTTGVSPVAQVEQDVTLPALPTSDKDLAPLEPQVFTAKLAVPNEPGKYQVCAELIPAPGRTGVSPVPGATAGTAIVPVASLRDFELISPEELARRAGLAVGKKASASSCVMFEGQKLVPSFAVDGLSGTRWSSEFSDPQWFQVDLGQPTQIARIEIAWEAAYGKEYVIQVSQDGKTWQDVTRKANGSGGLDVLRFKPVSARYVRFNGARRGTQWGYSFWEFRVFSD
ncbi:MAG: Beta-galactosidase [Planctomycetes bacterium ADurb.Bin126]|nr:MAG: Beta-galactosidase [Planctomycetes bacterium ADurb.Bin126]HOD80723.1 discoidin domain-containing protein [Phycisphaerae bacterium]HQL74923.1 discoidin domain-containing protein [Phycisphaerae bacterium]